MDAAEYEYEGNAETALVLELYNYKLHRWSDDGGVWRGKCEAPDGRCLCECSGPDRHAVNDRLTKAAFEDWVKR